LLENEKQKMEDLENAHQQAMDSWTQTIGPRQQVRVHEYIHFADPTGTLL